MNETDLESTSEELEGSAAPTDPIEDVIKGPDEAHHECINANVPRALTVEELATACTTFRDAMRAREAYEDNLDREISELVALVDRRREKLAADEERRNLEEADRREKQRQADIAAAIRSTRSILEGCGVQWTPGTCTVCGADIPDWDKQVPRKHRPSLGLPALQTTCEPCSEKAEAERRQKHEEEIAAMHTRNHKARFCEAWESIPAMFRDDRLADMFVSKTLQRPDALERAKQIFELPPTTPIVTFVGQTMSGKTTLACAVLAKFIERGSTFGGPSDLAKIASHARFHLAAELAQARQRSRLGEEADAITDAIEASVLLLDELGQEPARFSEVIAEVIQVRHAEKRLTLITTGLSSEEVLAKYGAGIARRVADPRSAFVIKCGLTKVDEQRGGGPARPHDQGRKAPLERAG